MRKILTFLFAALMSASMFALTPQSGDTWDDDTKTLTVNSDLPVDAYRGQTVIEHVIINSGVTSVGNSAFYLCSNLETVAILAESLESYGTNAFHYTAATLKIYVPAGSVDTYKAAWTVYADQIKAIPPAWVRDGDEWDDATKTLTVNSDLPENAYKDQTVIEHVIISIGVTSIGYGAFFGCTGLTSIVVASWNITYDSRGNCNAIIETSSNTLIVGCKNTIIPNGVTSIGVGAFAYCTGLTSITIPNSVTSIGDGTAFYGCTGLTSVTIGDHVTSIGDYTFFGCTGLTSVTIPNSVKSIGQMAFKSCSGLASIEIPNSVTSIGEAAFAECSNLETVTINAESLESYGTDAFEGTAAALKIYVPAGSVDTYKGAWTAYADKIEAIPAPANPSGSCGDNLSWEFDSSSGTLTITGTGDMYDYDDELNYAPWMSFYESITSVIIPEGVTSIGDVAFAMCSGLTSIEIPNGVTSIGQLAFLQCGLTSVTIPNSVNSIGFGAFGMCGLTSVTIGNSVTSIGQMAFGYCPNITDVYCYPNAANLTWNVGEEVDFKADGSTVCHVPSNYYNEYLAKFDATVNVTFVGDLPASDFAITPNADPDHEGVYYSTFYDSSAKYALPSGVEAFIVTAVSGDAMQLKQIAVAGQTIPANNAVILKSTVTPFTLTPSEADAVTFSATNSLQGVDADTEISAKVTGTCYVLSGTQAEGVGFFQYEAPNLLKAYKAFVDRPNGASGAPRRMRFVYDQATGIENGQMTNDERLTTKIMRDGQLIIIRNGVEYNANGMMVK